MRILTLAFSVFVLLSACAGPGDGLHFGRAKPKPGAGVNERDVRLLKAANTGNRKAAEEALREGASPNARDFYDLSPLLCAVSRHDLEMTRLLLDHGADPNQAKKDGVTPIFLATVFPDPDANDLSLASLLVEKGADVSRPTKYGQTPLQWVAFHGYLPIAEFLVNHGANVNAVDRYGQSPLRMAKRQNREEMIEFLVKHGATAQ